MAMLKTRQVILAKIESTYGTDPTPTTSSNAVEVFNLTLTPQSTVVDRRPHGLSLSRPATFNTKKKYQLKFDCEIKGSGSAGTAPRYSPLLKACNLSETVTGGVSVVYAPDSDSYQSCTIWFYADGIRYVATGCVGNVEFDFQTGKQGLMHFTFDGIYSIPTDVTFPTGMTLDSVTALPCEGMTATFGSYSFIADSCKINVGNTVTERESLIAADGIVGFQVTDRNPEGTITPEAVLRATTNADFWSYWDAGTTKALSLALTGSAGNIVTIAASTCTIKEVKLGDRNGINTFEIPFILGRASTAGEDEFSITLT